MIDYPVGPANTTLSRMLRVLTIMLSPFIVWGICVLLTADTRPRGEARFASIALPIVILGFIVMLIWSHRAARSAPPPVDDGWPKSHMR